MGITVIEQIGIIAGVVLGACGFIYSIAQSLRQKKFEREQAAERREQAAEQRRWEEKQAAEQRRWEEKQAAEQREREEKQTAEQREREEKQAVEQRKQAAEQRKWEEEQTAKQELRDRLFFLANIIMDKGIPRKTRQPFFDEYIAKGGNGTFVKFWYDEEKELEGKR